jgi:hypothetical protein
MLFFLLSIIDAQTSACMMATALLHEAQAVIEEQTADIAEAYARIDALKAELGALKNAYIGSIGA